jgi:uncharacterized LabA/DUF88 family protein
MPISSPGSQPVQYLFIDGAYLDGMLARFETELYGGRRMPISHRRLSDGFRKVFYYNCPPPAMKEESGTEYERRIETYLDRMMELGQLHGWHVFHGVTKRQPKRGNLQKEVDVQIAVDLLSHSFKKNMDQVTLIAGDQDFRPVVEAVVRDGMFVTLWSDPRTTSRELRDAADSGRLFDPWAYNSLLDGIPREQQRVLPERHYRSGGKYPATAILEATTTMRRRFIVFDQGGGSYCAISQHVVDEAYHAMYQVGDLALLRQFVEQQHGPVQWREIISDEAAQYRSATG